MSCSRGIDLSRNPVAPARSASTTCSSASNVVSMTTAVCSSGSALIRRAAWMPSSRGIRMSTRATSGRSSRHMRRRRPRRRTPPRRPRGPARPRGSSAGPARTSASSSASSTRTVMRGPVPGRARAGRRRPPARPVVAGARRSPGRRRAPPAPGCRAARAPARRRRRRSRAPSSVTSTSSARPVARPHPDAGPGRVLAGVGERLLRRSGRPWPPPRPAAVATRPSTVDGDVEPGRRAPRPGRSMSATVPGSPSSPPFVAEHAEQPVQVVERRPARVSTTSSAAPVAGSRPPRAACAASACSSISVTPCPTTSCISRAIRRRSAASAAARAGSSSRTAPGRPCLPLGPHRTVQPLARQPGEHPDEDRDRGVRDLVGDADVLGARMGRARSAATITSSPSSGVAAAVGVLGDGVGDDQQRGEPGDRRRVPDRVWTARPAAAVAAAATGRIRRSTRPPVISANATCCSGRDPGDLLGEEHELHLADHGDAPARGRRRAPTATAPATCAQIPDMAGSVGRPAPRRGLPDGRCPPPDGGPGLRRPAPDRRRGGRGRGAPGQRGRCRRDGRADRGGPAMTTSVQPRPRTRRTGSPLPAARRARRTRRVRRRGPRLRRSVGAAPHAGGGGRRALGLVGAVGRVLAGVYALLGIAVTGSLAARLGRAADTARSGCSPCSARSICCS